jgi:putative membrane protein
MRQPFPKPSVNVAEARARRFIWTFSGIVFGAVMVLNRVQVAAPDGLDVHVFARINAVINSAVSLLLIAGLLTARAGRWALHRGVMTTALALSVLFLASYITHHLFAGDTRFGGDGLIKALYYIILATHIVLAAGSLPYILFTAYRALSGRYPEHRKLARRVWPIWLYVSVSGVVVYLLISPYY